MMNSMTDYDDRGRIDDPGTPSRRDTDAGPRRRGCPR